MKLHFNRFTFPHKPLLVLSSILCTCAMLYYAYSGLWCEIEVLRLQVAVNKQQIEAQQKTQDWMQAEIFYLRGRKYGRERTASD